MIGKELEKIKNLIRKVVRIPQPPILGKIEKVYERQGKADFLNCLYSADVRFIKLAKDGHFEDTELVVPDIPILTIGLGDERGIFFLPEKGSIVKVSFLYGEKSYPVIDGILPYRKSIPQHNKDDLNIKVPNNKLEDIKNLWKGSYSKVELTAPAGFYFTGDVNIEGNLKVSQNITAQGQISDLDGSKGTLSQLRETFDKHTHTGDSGGNTSPPKQTI